MIRLFISLYNWCFLLPDEEGRERKCVRVLLCWISLWWWRIGYFWTFDSQVKERYLNIAFGTEGLWKRLLLDKWSFSQAATVDSLPVVYEESCNGSHLIIIVVARFPLSRYGFYKLVVVGVLLPRVYKYQRTATPPLDGYQVAPHPPNQQYNELFVLASLPSSFRIEP